MLLVFYVFVKRFRIPCVASRGMVGAILCIGGHDPIIVFWVEGFELASGRG